MTPTDRQLLRTPPARKQDAFTTSPRETPEKVVTPRKEHQRFVLTDPVASRYLAGDSATTVLERGSTLPGYESYVVEQWAVSRTNPTFMITTYTGDASHVVVADVLALPRDEKSWSPRLKVFFKALNQYHAKREATPLGTLMVTNLSGFPSSLTVIPVPDGNVIEHRLHFFVNVDLKRLGCLGRIGLNLGTPPSSAVAKFHQIYHTSEKNDVEEAVVQMVRFCQLALYLFDKLDVDYTDGLLCDATEQAISRWWNDVGAEHYGVEPHDGPLGPTTVAALLGLLMGARNRLRSFGIAVPKDALDIEGMKRGISQFQKQQRLPRTRRLDRATLKLLKTATAKAAAGDGWTVPRAVKSTVAELSGRGGEMLSDAVRKRDRSGIAEVETTDYEAFVDLAYGPYARWLWHGKALKNPTPAMARLRNHQTHDRHAEKDSPRTPGGDTDGSGIEDHKTGLRKRATDLRNDAKTGLGKIKTVVHRRNRPQQQDEGRSPQSMPRSSYEDAPKSDYSSPASPFSGPTSPLSPGLERMPDFSLAQSTAPAKTSRGKESSQEQSPHRKHPVVVMTGTGIEQRDFQPEKQQLDDGARHQSPIMDFSDLPELPSPRNEIATALRRTASDSAAQDPQFPWSRPRLQPKHLSFTLAEDTVMLNTASDFDSSDYSSADDEVQYAAEMYQTEHLRQLQAALQGDLHGTASWTEQQLLTLRQLVEQTGHDHHAAEEAYEPRAEAMQSLVTSIDVLLRNEREHVEEGSKELETLAARLNYETNGLKGRIEDVDQVVDDFEDAVIRVEARVHELERRQDDRSSKCLLM